MSSLATGIAAGIRRCIAPVLSQSSDAESGSHAAPPVLVVETEASARKSLQSLILLCLRVLAAATLLGQANAGLLTANSVDSAIFAVLVSAAAIFLLLGLSTSSAGTLPALVELRNGLSHSGNPWTCIELGAIGAAVAMIGPGQWSLDARCLPNGLRKRGAPRYPKSVIK